MGLCSVSSLVYLHLCQHGLEVNSNKSSCTQYDMLFAANMSRWKAHRRRSRHDDIEALRGGRSGHRDWPKLLVEDGVGLEGCGGVLGDDQTVLGGNRQAVAGRELHLHQLTSQYRFLMIGHRYNSQQTLQDAKGESKLLRHSDAGHELFVATKGRYADCTILVYFSQIMPSDLTAAPKGSLGVRACHITCT